MNWMKRQMEIARRILADNSVYSLAEIAARVSRHSAFPSAADSHSILKAFVENAPGAIAMLDQDLRFLQVSNRWLQDTGAWRLGGALTNTDVIGRFYQDALPDTSPKWIEICQRGVAGFTKRNDGQRFVRADGHVQWIKWEIQPWRDVNGAIGGIMVMTEDITTLKLTEERLSSLTAKMQTATSGSGFGIWEWELGTNNVSIDRQASRLIGYVPPSAMDGEEYRAINSMWISALHPEDMDAVAEAAGRALKGESGVVHTYRINRLDNGELRYLRTHFSKRTDPMSQRDFLTAVCWDVTRAAEMEAALAESEERFRSLFEVIPVGVVLTSMKDGRFIAMNRIFCEMTGYTQDELSKLTVEDITPTKYQAEEEIGRERLFAEGRYDAYE